MAGDSGFGQNLGRDSGFATSGGSGIKSFFMAGNGISRHRRDRDLDFAQNGPNSDLNF